MRNNRFLIRSELGYRYTNRLEAMDQLPDSFSTLTQDQVSNAVVSRQIHQLDANLGMGARIHSKVDLYAFAGASLILNNLTLGASQADVTQPPTNTGTSEGVAAIADKSEVSITPSLLPRGSSYLGIGTTYYPIRKLGIDARYAYVSNGTSVDYVYDMQTTQSTFSQHRVRLGIRYVF